MQAHVCSTDFYSRSLLTVNKVTCIAHTSKFCRDIALCVPMPSTQVHVSTNPGALPAAAIAPATASLPAAGPAAVAAAAADVPGVVQPEQEQQLQPHVIDTTFAAGMPGLNGTERSSPGGRWLPLLQSEYKSSSTSDDHNSDDTSSSDSGEEAEAEQHSREQAGGSTADVPAVSLQPQQRKRHSEHDVDSRTGSMRHKGSSSSSAVMPAAAPAMLQRKTRSKLPVVELSEDVWHVGGMVRDCWGT
jgi:hypothetical protein